MKAIGVTYNEQTKCGNYQKNDKYDTLMQYLVLHTEKIDNDTYISVILKDVKFGYKNYKKSKKRRQLRQLIKQNHIKKVNKMIR